MTIQVRHVTDAEIVPKGFDPYDEAVFIFAELWPALNSDSTSTPQPVPPVRRGVFLLPNILTTGCHTFRCRPQKETFRDGGGCGLRVLTVCMDSFGPAKGDMP